MGPAARGRGRLRRGGHAVPRPHARLDQAQRRRHQGPHDHPGGLRLSQRQRPPAQGARPLLVHPPVQGLRGRSHPLPRDRHRHRAREHRGPLRGDRVRGRQRRRQGPDPLRLGARRCADPRALRHLDQADLGVRLRAHRARGLRLRQGERPRARDGGPQGEHHEVLGRAVPRGGAEGRGGLSGHRIRGPHHRQPLQPARVAP